MSELTLTLKGEAATRLERLMRNAAYPSAEAAIADALEALEENLAPELDTWLRDVVGPRLDDMRANPERSLTVEQVRTRLFRKS
jgi:hypothetical protein